MEKIKERFLVIGGSGKNGRRVIQKLRKIGMNVLSTTRMRGDVDETKRFFDWNDTDSFDLSLKDIKKVYIVHPDTSVPEAYGQIEKLIKSMEEQSVSKAVLLSGRGQESVRKCEDLLMNSRLEWSIIRSAWFNQNFSEGHFLHGIKSGEVTFMADAIKEPFVDLDDLSDVIVQTLIHEEHNGKIYEVTGDELLSFEEVVTMIGTRLGKNIYYNSLNKDEYFRGLINAGLEDSLARHLVWTFGEILDGRNASIGDGILKVLNRKSKKVIEFVESEQFE